MQKVAVFGSAGQLGLELVKEFRLRGYEVTALNRASVDVTDAKAVEECLAQLRPKVVVNAAAYNQVDLAESDPQASYSANALPCATSPSAVVIWMPAWFIFPPIMFLTERWDAPTLSQTRRIP